VTTIADYPYDFRLALLARTRRAWVTSLLVGINIAVLIPMTVAGADPWSPAADDVLKWGADYGPYITAGQWWRPLTAMFVHGGAPHLCMNMLVLMQIGPLVERLLGNRRFAVVYLISGLCASLASIVWNPYAVSAGASGAILGVFGVLIAYLARYHGSIPPEVSKPLRKSAAIFVVLNVALGLLLKRVDVAGHVAGFLAGAGAALLVARPLTANEPPAPVSREMFLLVVGFGMVAGAAALLPPTFDLRAEIAGFAVRDIASLAPYTAAVERRRGNRFSDADVAEVIDQQMLPPLRASQGRLGGLRRLRGVQKEWVSKALAYITVRERAWSRLSEALRKGDRGKAAEASALHTEADDLAAALSPKRRS
jgi:rhomboid protease GluP